MGTPQEIGKIFIEARERRNLSQTEASRESRIHPDVITDLEEGTFDRLGKIYIKSFLRKYSEFLELDSEDMLSKYKTISSEIAGLDFDLSEFDKEKAKWSKTRKISAKKPEEKQGENASGKQFTAPKLSIPKINIPKITIPKFGFTRQQTEAMAIAVLALVLIMLVSTLVGKIRSKVSSGNKREAVIAAKAIGDDVAKKEAEPIKKKAISKKLLATAKAKKSKSVTLTLKSRQKVWLKVTEGKKTLFVGIFGALQSTTWSSEGVIKVWTGKTEMLDFTVNGQDLGVVAKGVINNIFVSSDGVRVGDKWVARLKD